MLRSFFSATIPKIKYEYEYVDCAKEESQRNIPYFYSHAG